MTLTHEEIAQMIGTTRETVTRALARFKRLKLIEVRGATLVLKNRGALQELAGRGANPAPTGKEFETGGERERQTSSFRVLKDKQAACVTV
jgi:hypothetical protein